MEWVLKWGPHIKAFEAKRKKTGVAPKPLLSMPQIQQQDLEYYNAFQTVNNSRSYGDMGGARALQISEILAYCQMVGIAKRAERVKYLGLIQQLDQIWLKHAAETQKTKKP